MASQKYGWRPSHRNYEAERRRESYHFDPADSHPLVTVVKTVEVKTVGGGEKKADKPKVVDPLSGGGGGGGFIDPLSVGTDPLSAAAIQDPLSAALFTEPSAPPTSTASRTAGGSAEDANMLADDFEPWSAKKTSILSRYTTSEKISITTSFLSSEEKEKLETKAQAASADTFKHRLEQLDDIEEGSVRETLTVNQKEYVAKIDQLNRNLERAWEREQKVKALKIAIQCAKLLVDTAVIQFYPSKFVLSTEILDNFGKLVFERIRLKSSFVVGIGEPQPLPENFTPDQVPDSAKETCRNWFFKIASIRELIPRFYMEAAILRCYSFLADKEYSQALIRLAHMTRGMGNPLVAAYARTYLCRVGMMVAPATRNHILPCFHDTLITLPQLESDKIQDVIALQRIEMKVYTGLYEPAFDWIFQCVAHRCSESVLEEVLVQVKDTPPNTPCRGLLVYSVMSSFSPEYIASRALLFSELIQDLADPHMPRSILYTALGSNVVLADPPKADRLTLLREVWKMATKIADPKEYIVCAEMWIEYVSKHFTKREVNNFLGDVIKHMTVDRAFEKHYPQLLSIISKVLAHMHNFSEVFAMDRFLPFVDLLQKDSLKVDACRSIANAFLLWQKEPTNDPVILNAMLYICKVMHDSLNALSLEDDCRHISLLINTFISRVSFGHDFEQQLSFYVDARASFTNLDRVLVHLVHSVNQLAMRTYIRVKGTHTGKTSSFVRACFAYSFITIPSLSNVLSKLSLYLISGRVAIANGALSQGDAFLKTAITLIPEVPDLMEIDGKRQSTESRLSIFVRNFMSALLVVPDNPDQGAVYLFGGLLNGLKRYSWQTNSLVKVEVFSSAFCYLSAACQEAYMYQVHNVDCNDSLYASDPKFIAELTGLVDSVLDVLVETVEAYTEPGVVRVQHTHNTRWPARGKAALIIFSKLVYCSDFSDERLTRLAQRLWKQIDSTSAVPFAVKEACRRRVAQLADGASTRLLVAT